MKIECRQKRMRGISLGEDLEREILVRLPVKSLMRFKSVQRSWNVLFKTPTFVTRHSHMHASDGSGLMILQESDPCIELLSCADPTLTPTRPPMESLFPNYSPSPARRIFTYGYCNGVFCLKCSDSQLILWNPTTREVHLIPPPPSNYHNDVDFFLCGFGADPNTNDLKVVKLNADIRKNYSLSSAEIYNLSTKSWTLIHRPPPTRILRKRPSEYHSLVNSIYHWISDYSPDGVANILCFDFSNNQFRELLGPISRLVVNFVRDEVAEVNGSLAYIAEYNGPIWLRIWVMDQCGWVNKYNIRPFEPRVRIRGIWKDGAQLLGGKVGQPLMSYDHDGNSVHQFQFDIDDSYIYIYEYVPSLTPLST